MATPDQRLKILEMSKPGALNPDRTLWLTIARELEAYVDGTGHGAKAPPEPPQKTLQLPQDRNTRQPPAPAHRR